VWQEDLAMHGRIKTALLSVFKKDGIEHFARALIELGWNILASAGTVKYLKEHGIEARDIAEIVGPPILGHRVVTLSREIHAALLAKDTPEDDAELARIGVPRINLVYVDLYPLAEEVARPGATLASVTEKTDIGGPALLRSAAKGRRLVVCRTDDAKTILGHLKRGYESWSSDEQERVQIWLAHRAEYAVAEYCMASAEYLKKHF